MNEIKRIEKDEVVKAQSTEVARQTSLVVGDDRVKRLKSLQDLVGSIYNRVHEIKDIYQFNYNRGIKFVEIGQYDAPLDYKLNQLDADVTLLREIFNPVERDDLVIDHE